MSHRSLSLVLALACICLLISAGKSSGEDGAKFATYLSAQQLVVDGVLEEVDTVTKSPAGGCGEGSWGPNKSLDLRIHVEEVIIGTIDDSNLVLTTLVRENYGRAGDHILAWGERQCGDNWHVWGEAAIKYSSGSLTFADYGSQWIDQPFSYSTLRNRLANQDVVSATRMVDGSTAIALVRVRSVAVAQDKSSVTYACDSMTVVEGRTASVPRSLTFLADPPCYPFIGKGDSLLIPLDATNPRSMTLNTCPYDLKVQYGFARGFGVPLSNLSYAVRNEGGRLKVLSFVQKH